MGKYTEQIKYLTENPEHIENSWNNGEGLFKVASNKTTFQYDPSPDNIIRGCLTQIRSNEHVVAIFGGVIDRELTEMIRNDDRIPLDIDDVTPQDLPVFEYYQELIDKKIEELK